MNLWDTQRQMKRTITQRWDWETSKAVACRCPACQTQARGARAHRLLLLREWNSVPFQGGQGNPDSPTDDHSQSRAQDRKSLSMWRQKNATLWTKGKVVSGSQWTFLNRGKRHRCIFQKDHSGSHWERTGPGLAQWVLLAECPNGSEGWWWRYRWGPAYLWVLCSHYNHEMSELKIS